MFSNARHVLRPIMEFHYHLCNGTLKHPVVCVDFPGAIHQSQFSRQMWGESFSPLDGRYTASGLLHIIADHVSNDMALKASPSF